jgi:hypothetical protein
MAATSPLPTAGCGELQYGTMVESLKNGFGLLYSTNHTVPNLQADLFLELRRTYAFFLPNFAGYGDGLIWNVGVLA